MLPGLKPIPGFFSGRGSTAGTLSLITSVTSTASTIAWPTVQSGDLAILSDGAGGLGVVPTDVVPTGFAGFSTNGGSNVRWRGSYKKCTGSESGNITGMNGNYVNSKVLLIVRSTGSITTITPSVFDVQISSGSPSQRTILASQGTSPLIVLGVAFANTSDPSWATQTPNWQGTVTGAARTNLGYRIYNANPVVDQVIDMGDYGYNIMAGGYIQVA